MAKKDTSTRDETGQNATLSATQEIAIAALLEGHTVTDAAAAAGVTRQTVHRWTTEDSEFAAEMNRQRLEIRTAYRRRVERLAEHAIGAVETAIGEGDAKTALAILKSLGLLDSTTIGPTDAEEIAQNLEINEMRRQEQLERDRLFATIGA